MKINNMITPQSSFLSNEKDLKLIVNTILKNERLKRLLFYTTKDCLTRKNITEDETYELINKNIKIVPKLKVDESVLNYLLIKFDFFTPNDTNPQFRNNLIMFDIVCHFDQWNLNDFALRPFKIAAEIDSMFNGKHLTGIGTLEFISCEQFMLNDEFGGLCLIYQAIHGDEDKAPLPNPADQDRFNSDYKGIYS